MKLKYKILTNRIFRYIKYLRKEGISWLQDKEGNLISIDIKLISEMLECWQNKPIECKIEGKEAICYKNDYYIKIEYILKKDDKI